MKLNKKQIISVLVAIAGIFLIFYAMHAKGELASAESGVNAVTAPFSSTAPGGMTKRYAEGKISGYNQQVQWLMIAGVILLIAGGACCYMCRKKR